MSSIKWFKNLLFIENVLGVNRNYCNQTKMKKYFILFYVFVLILLHSVYVVLELIEFLTGEDTPQINYIYSSLAITSHSIFISSALTSIFYSHAFNSYLENINRASEYFENDEKFKKSMKRTNHITITVILFAVVFVLFTTTQILMEKAFDFDKSLVIPILFLQTIQRMLILLEYIMLFVAVIMVYQLIKCLNSWIFAVQKSVDNCGNNSDEKCNITSEQIHEWVELYQHLANCCETMTLCFGRQFFFTLVFSVTNYILITYQLCYAILTTTADLDANQKMGLIIFSYIIIFVLPIVAGQMTRNQGVKFHRVVTRLYNTMIFYSNEAESKLLKDFIRVIKKNPLELKLLSKLPTGIYMLPIILTMAVNYIIVMLQFNHVL